MLNHFCIDITSKQNKFMKHVRNIVTIPCEKIEIVVFTRSRMKEIVLFPAWSTFPVKLICSIAFGLVSSASCILRSMQSNHNFL